MDYDMNGDCRKNKTKQKTTDKVTSALRHPYPQITHDK